jgi:hypothetical protein
MVGMEDDLLVGMHVLSHHMKASRTHNSRTLKQNDMTLDYLLPIHRVIQVYHVVSYSTEKES